MGNRRVLAVLFVMSLISCQPEEKLDPRLEPISAREAAFFCPQCWDFLTHPGAADSSGACAKCRLPPVEVDASPLAFYACRRHREWRREPCGFAATEQCCKRNEVLVLEVSPVENGIFTLRFCPGCRKFAGVEDWPAELSRCPRCEWTPLETSVVLRSWTWCKSERRWRDGPCRKARAEGCCSEKSGVLPARSTEVPLVSLFSPSDNGNGVLVTTDWLQEHLEDPDVVVVHVDFGAGAYEVMGRTLYGEGHIPKARLLRWEEIVETRNGVPDEMPSLEALTQVVRKLGLRASNRIILYDTGVGIEAARAFVTLDYLGLADRAALLDGQWRKWLREQRMISTTVSEVAPSAVTPKIRRDVLLPLGGLVVLDWLARQSTVGLTLLDARSPAEYLGDESGEGIARPGHIPGAKNLCWIANIESVENPVLRSQDQLRSLYERVGARRNGFLVAYCRTGVEASTTYFVGKLLGYPVRLYDGSFAEWSAKKHLGVRRGESAD